MVSEMKLVVVLLAFWCSFDHVYSTCLPEQVSYTWWRQTMRLRCPSSYPLVKINSAYYGRPCPATCTSCSSSSSFCYETSMKGAQDIVEERCGYKPGCDIPVTEPYPFRTHAGRPWLSRKLEVRFRCCNEREFAGCLKKVRKVRGNPAGRPTIRTERGTCQSYYELFEHYCDGYCHSSSEILFKTVINWDRCRCCKVNLMEDYTQYVLCKHPDGFPEHLQLRTKRIKRCACHYCWSR